MANYIVNFTDVTASPITILEGEINLTSVDIALFGRARLEYGEHLNETILHLLENFSCYEDDQNPGNPDLEQTHSELLSNPTKGQFWHNMSVGLIYYWDGDMPNPSWVPLRRADDVVAAHGIIDHGEQIPQLVSPVTGHVFEYDECIWSVAPLSYPNTISVMSCGTDENATVTMQYMLDGIVQDGTANYLIIGVRGKDENSGTLITPPPVIQPTPTPPDQTVPTVISPTYSITPGQVTSATLGATVSDDGNDIIVERGIVWGTSPNPTGNAVTTGGQLGTFTVPVTGLYADTLIYFRGYAVNAQGTGYSVDSSFTLGAQAQPPTIIDPAHYGISSNSATLGANVTNDGGSPITARGIVWGYTNNPTTNPTPHASNTTGSFIVSATGMDPSTTIYYRGYASNAIGTSYTVSNSFDTAATATVPIVITPIDFGVTTDSATLGATVISDGGNSLTEKGIVWNLTGAPDLGDNVITHGDTDVEAFTVFGDGVFPTDDTVYYRGYATNGIGTGYSTDGNFTTLSSAELPTVINPTAVDITNVSARLGGTVSDDGGDPVYGRGVKWGPSHATLYYTLQMGSGLGEFSDVLTGLANRTTYAYRPYAQNNVGVGWTVAYPSFTTHGNPIVTTPTDSSVTATTATLGALVEDDGGVSLSARGIVWDTSTGPTIADNVETIGGQEGVYTIDVTGLPPNDTVYYRGYATNQYDTTYSDEKSIQTSVAAVPPTVENPDATNIAGTTATLEAEVTDVGGAGVVLSDRGIVWNTAGTPTVDVYDGKYSVPGQLGQFEADVTGLPAETTIYYRGYATNSAGTGYTSDVITFDTLSATHGNVLPADIYKEGENLPAVLFVVSIRGDGGWDTPWPDAASGDWLDTGFLPGQDGSDYDWEITALNNQSGSDLEYESGGYVQLGDSGNMLTGVHFVISEPPGIGPASSHAIFDVTITGPNNSDVISIEMWYAIDETEDW